MGGCPVFSISGPGEAPMKSEAFKIIALLVCMAWLTGGCSTGPDTDKQPVNKIAVGGFTGKTKSRDLVKTDRSLPMPPNPGGPRTDV